MQNEISQAKTALVIGATGGIGGEVAAALVAHGWRVRALARSIAKALRQPAARGIDWIEGDAMNAADVADATAGVDLIVHAANPPGYRDWDKLALPMLENTIAAARAAGARILFPGTIYNFGPDAFPVLREDSPQRPRTRKGAIRVAMERRLQEAAEAGVPVLIVRAGDFFGPRTGNNWFAQAVVKPGRPLGKIVAPGARGVGHAWAYLPDLAQTMVLLAERQPVLSGFAVFHFKGHWDADGSEMTAAIRRVSGKPDLPVRRFPWALVWLASPFGADTPRARLSGPGISVFRADRSLGNGQRRREAVRRGPCLIELHLEQQILVGAEAGREGERHRRRIEKMPALLLRLAALALMQGGEEGQFRLRDRASRRIDAKALHHLEQSGGTAAVAAHGWPFGGTMAGSVAPGCRAMIWIKRHRPKKEAAGAAASGLGGCGVYLS